MNLIRCTDDKGQTVTCAECSARVPLAECHADTDGEPFRAYYCARCVAAMED